MLRDRIAQQLSDQLGQLFSTLTGSDAGEERNELQKSVHSIVQNVLEKLDLVTREEFDAQRQVLQKAQRKVDELEQQLQQISDGLDG